MEDGELYGALTEIQMYSLLLLKFGTQAIEERLQAYGVKITSLQHGILQMLQVEPLTISAISQRMGMDPSTLVRAVDVLEREGLARRGSDPRDRRRNPLSLTEKGRELVTAVPMTSRQDPTFKALEKLGDESVRQLRDLLRRLMLEFPEGRQVVAMMAGQATDR